MPRTLRAPATVLARRPAPPSKLPGRAFARFAPALLAWAALGAAPACAPAAPPAPEQACNGSPKLCDRRFDDVTFPTTHNAFSVQDEGFVAFNQHNPLEQQLEDGVRAMMLDLHPYQGGVFLCHGRCEWGKRSFEEALGAIKAFLDAHPDEVVAFQFESYVAAADVEKAFETSGMRSLVYTHAKGTPWPTLREMIAAHQRVVAFYEDGKALEGGPDGATAGDGAPDWYQPLFENSFETPFSAKKPEDLGCDMNRGTPGAPLFTLNHFLTDVAGSPDYAEQVNHDPFLLDRARRCETAFGKRPNFVAVDFYDIGDLFAAVRALNGI